MKFAKEFDRELVPEWRAKYLNYKQGKKKLKVLDRAIRNAGKSSPSGFRQNPSGERQDGAYPVFNLLRQNLQLKISRDDKDGRSTRGANSTRATTSPVAVTPSRPRPIGSPNATEHSPLSTQMRPDPRTMTRYGSIIGTPPNDNDHLQRVESAAAPSFHLPGPAIESEEDPKSPVSLARRLSQQSSMSDSAANLPPGVSLVGPRKQPSKSSVDRRFSSVFQPRRVSSSPMNPVSPTSLSNNSKKPFLQRVLKPGRSVTFSSADALPLEAYKDVEDRRKEFFDFLDSQLEMIDGFYKEKEEAATERLHVLRDQLHIMRDSRMDEVTRAEQTNGHIRSEITHWFENGKAKDVEHPHKPSADAAWLSKAVDMAKPSHSGKTFRAMKDLGTPQGPSAIDMNKDYVRKPLSHDVPYRTAKHKLKVALAEYYRGLELLKSYAMLNRTAFRKIIKKYDKTVKARPTGQYMNEKVSKAYFVNSEVIEGHMHAVEDLYSRYFERGNRKLAVGKLRAKVATAGEYSRASFINGLFLALGAAFGIEGLVFASGLLNRREEILTLQTTYLLQLYGGYFLAIFLSLLFCLACRVWHLNKVNYTFIFEFDTRRRVLDWRQLTEIPSVLWFLLGITMWFNFRELGGPAMFLWWPVLLTGLILLVLLNPLPLLYPKSRLWFSYSLWRLFFAGIYPVEFRDFFMGDLFCSEVYAMANIELFFCVYAQHPIWSHPVSCSSLHSRLYGFLACLPGIWRALQCIRRYRDTKNAFPHLVNCGKYMFTILQYMSLSLYRLDFAVSTRAIFIVCGTINGLYTSVWDLAMDWSLLDPYAKHKFLRQTLAYKRTWVYYTAMVVDPIIRFNFLLYAFYTEDPKHAALVSFFVSFTEVCRRGMWMIFRVENEHCANVGRFRAYRDAPLPYQTSVKASDSRSDSTDSRQGGGGGQASPKSTPAHETGVQVPENRPYNVPDLEASGRQYREHAENAAAEMGSGLRRRRSQASKDSPVARALTRVGTLIHFAHTQDFERKRKPGEDGAGGSGDAGGRGAGGHDEDDESDDEDHSDSEVEDEATELARMRSIMESDRKAR